MKGLLVLALALGLLLSAVPAPAHTVNSRELRASRLINADRTRHGLKALMFGHTLSRYARAHAYATARQQRLYHSSRSTLRAVARKVCSCWGYVAEIVGVGPSVESVNLGFMDSYGHRSIIFKPFWIQLGTGVSVGADRNYYVTALFWSGG